MDPTCSANPGGGAWTAEVGRERDIIRVMDALRDVVRALRLSTRAMERSLGISGAQLFVLQQLEGAPIRSVSDLAERTGTHQSTVSVVISRLVQRGLVTRERAPEDGRRQEVAITDEGRAVVQSAPPTPQTVLVDVLRRTPAARVAELAAALDALVREFGLVDQPVAMFFEDADDQRVG